VAARLIRLAEVDEALMERWRALGRDVPDPNPFAQADFVVPAARWLGWSTSLAVAVVERGRELRFALPVTRLRGFHGIPVPAIGTWLHPYSPLGTPLVHKEQSEETWLEAAGLVGGATPWAVLRLFPSDGHAFRALDVAQWATGRPVPVIDQPSRPVALRRPGTTGTERMRAKHRKGLARQRRRLAERLGGPLEATVLGEPGRELDRAVDGFLTMEASGWKGHGGGAMACRPGHGAFFQDMCRRFAAAGELQFWILRAGGRILAYQCNLLAGDCVFVFKITYDEEFRAYSPGAQLMVETVRWFHTDGGRDTYDSCLGSGNILHDLFPDRRPMADVLLPTGLRGWAAARTASAGVAAYRGAARRLHWPARPAGLPNADPRPVA
jgi:CelD/BcsL family acetyltransferase involved in cellulose biosynthesis